MCSNKALFLHPVPMVSFDFYKPSFFSKFLESHTIMAEVSTMLLWYDETCGHLWDIASWLLCREVAC